MNGPPPIPAFPLRDIKGKGKRERRWFELLTPAMVTAHGSLMQYLDGTWTYTPDANYNGADNFTYRVNDGSADPNLATVTLSIAPVNDAPVIATDTLGTVTLDEDVQVILDLL